MRAVWLREYGPAEALVPGVAPDPVAGPGQAVVAVGFVNVTFVETQFRAGLMTNVFGDVSLPVVPGNGVGGVVVSVGPGVDLNLVGTRVVTSTGGSGGYAEAVAVDAAGLIEVPAGIDLADAVALLADGRTATGLANAARIAPGDRVLVEAAAGGVGSLLVQLARTAGATVVAAAGGPDKLALAAELGATVTVDYRQPDWADRVRAEVGGVDVVFDGVGGTVGAQAYGLLADGGRMVIHGLASGAFTEVDAEHAAAHHIEIVRGLRLPPEQLRELTRSALAEAAAGWLRPVIGQRFALAKAADAHALIEARATTGKTLLVP